MKWIRRAKRAHIVLSIILIVVGLLFLLDPALSLRVVCRLVGVLCLLFGAAKLAGYFSRDAYGLAFQFDLGLGLVALVLGILLLLRPEGAASLLQLLVGLFVVVDGILKLQTALDARRFGLPRWWVILLTAAVTAAAGLLLILNPLGGARAMMMLLGAALIAAGIETLIVVEMTVKYIEKHPPEDSAFDY